MLYKRIFKLGLVNFWRNRWLSLAATLVMTLTLIIISSFLILTLVIGKTTDSIREKMDISVYFNDSANVDKIVDLQKKLASRSDVREVKYISKEEALAIFKEQQEGRKVAELINPDENPLPRSLEIKGTQPEYLDQIAQYIAQDQFKPLLHNVSYQENKKVIQRLIGFTSFIKKMGWIASGVFVLISILVIMNTIRLTIFTRKDEIEIMRFVGANETFVRIPFIVEGVLYGLIAAVLATILIKIGVTIITPLMDQYLGIDFSYRMVKFFSSNFLMIIGVQLLVGIAIGISCSLISIRKYIKA